MEPNASADDGRAAPPRIVFVGGGNMATAILGGLFAEASVEPRRVLVVEPHEPQRRHLAGGFGVEVAASLDDAGAARAARAQSIVWAVKPQQFRDAARPLAGRAADALHVSVMAGVRSATLAEVTGAARIVRGMPNTPALIGRGITALVATPAVEAQDRARVAAMLAGTGQTLWLAREDALDAVTALSGSGPAYVFYLLEAMLAAGAAMGLEPDDARRLALATLEGSAALAARSTEPPEVLRQRVTSKGGTTHAAVTLLEDRAVGASIVDAIRAAQRRARELGDELAG